MEKQRHRHRNQVARSHESPVEGRVYNSRNPQYEGLARRDISSVDQQEGNMNNGELGGCFEREDNFSERQAAP